MNRAQKVELTTELKDKFSRAHVAIFADYKGLGASAADELRQKLREQGAEAKVVKNNVVRLALADGSDDVKKLVEGLVGPTLIAFAYKDSAAAAKVIHKFSEDHEALELKDGVMGDKVLGASEVKALADLPSREVLLSMLLSAMNGPARGFVAVLSAVPRGLVTALDQVREKKEKGEL